MSIEIRSFQGLFKGHFNIIFIDIDSMISRVYPNGLFEFDEIEIEPRTKNFKGFEKTLYIKKVIFHNLSI